MKKYTVSQAIDAWSQTQDVAANAILLRNLKTALRKYVLLQGDTCDQELKVEEFTHFCYEATLDILENALQAFDNQFCVAVEAGKVKHRTGENYRMALRRFLDWMHQQLWYHEMFPREIGKFAPQRVAVRRIPTAARAGRAKAEIEYKISQNELPRMAIEELDAWSSFWGQTVHEKKLKYGQPISKTRNKPPVPVLGERNLKNQRETVLRFWGWCVKFQSYQPQDLSLALLLDLDVLNDYIDWLITERGCTHAAGRLIVETAIKVAKWKNYDTTARRDWSDISLIQELRDFRSACQEAYTIEQKQNEDEKWPTRELTHEEARKIVEFLRQACAETYETYHKRDLCTVVWSWQIYLLVKYLTFCPVRQEEIRNLKLGHNIFREIDERGNPYYLVWIEHKNINKTGRRRKYKLPSILTQDLDDWIYIWRVKAAEATESLDKWLNFWGYKLDDIDKMQQRIQDAKCGIIKDKKVKDVEKYIDGLEYRLKSLKTRIAAWEEAKNNFLEFNSLFFSIGNSGHPGSFGKPFASPSQFGQLVYHAVARGSQALFNKTRYTNPHAFRHIAEKHIRLAGRTDKEAFGALIGHSGKMGDTYAKQIMSEADLTGNIVDNWWQ